ncbi:MAG: hypothetical protein EPN26_13820, partial [Rhodospirillales bacterium]
MKDTATQTGIRTSLPSPKDGNSLIRLFLVSLAALFLELALIRWIASEVRIFAYLQSAVLVVCMLGLGMGCFAQKRRLPLTHTALALLGLAILIEVPPVSGLVKKISMILAYFGDFHIWMNEIATPTLFQSLALMVLAVILATFILALTWLSFLPLGQMMSRLIDAHPNTVAAYSVNIVGSGAGIALFTLASVMGIPPGAWFMAVSLMLLALMPLPDRFRPALLVLVLSAPAVIGMGALIDKKGEIFWSPYQKLVLSQERHVDPASGQTIELQRISTNNILYQTMLDLRPETIASAPSLFDPAWTGLSQYDLPLAFKPAPERALIVGAGSGNDVAAALRGGAKHVVAVEIDPVIFDLGRRLHPERPYDSPAVEVVVDDARSYFARKVAPFDLIVFGLLDSHTTGQMTNARLDNYVYTSESIANARSLLAPGGIMVLAFEANKPHLADRIHATLKQTFGAAPLVFKVPTSFHGLGGVIFVSADAKIIDRALADNPRLAAHINKLKESHPVEIAGTTAPTTDDWPYLYLEKPGIPPLFALLIVILLVIYWAGGRAVGVSLKLGRWTRTEGHFFFLGAAFMLLEVTMIAKTTVVFGNTWVVNAVIIFGILSMILLANALVARWPNLPLRLVFAGLLIACGTVAFVDPSAFADNSPISKVFLVAASS